VPLLKRVAAVVVEGDGPTLICIRAIIAGAASPGGVEKSATPTIAAAVTKTAMSATTAMRSEAAVSDFMMVISVSPASERIVIGVADVLLDLLEDNRRSGVRGEEPVAGDDDSLKGVAIEGHLPVGGEENAGYRVPSTRD